MDEVTFVLSVQSDSVCLFICLCLTIVHPAPQLETATSCVVAADVARLLPALLAPTSASYNFTCTAVTQTVTQQCWKKAREKQEDVEMH